MRILLGKMRWRDGVETGDGEGTLPDAGAVYFEFDAQASFRLSGGFGVVTGRGEEEGETVSVAGGKIGAAGSPMP